MMAGKIKYNVFFVESNVGAENLYSWTCADLSTAVSEISAGLSFWSSKAANYGTPLTYSISYQRPIVKSGTTTLCSGTTKVFQPYEPIIHAGAGGAYDGDGLWINAIMANYGYGVGDKWARVNAYNSWSRTYYKTNWATSLFVAYNPAGAPTSFTNGYFAYAWVPNGPYSQVLWRNNGWLISDLDRIVAHETGHLFGADDEYGSSGCNNCNSSDASSKYVINGNCENCNPSHVGCIMNHNESMLCGYTPGQLGWGLDFNWVRTTPSAGSATEKYNWKPGQIVYYSINIDVPGVPGQCVNVASRWYRQFQSNLTESESFDQACLIQSGGTRTIWLQRAIPAGAQFGEAAFEVQLELHYTAPNMYGKGIRANTRGKFFVLPTSANGILTSPDLLPWSEPVAGEVIKK
jgi:hypothetical protein